MPRAASQISPATIAILTAIFSAALFCGLHVADALRPVEQPAYDYRFRLLPRPELASHDVVIIALDNASFEYPDMLDNFGRWPWNRKLYAQLLWYLRQAPARAIGIDITFAGHDPDKEADPLLAGMLAERPDTTLAFGLNEPIAAGREAPPLPSNPELERFAWPVRSGRCGPSRTYAGLEISLPDFTRHAAALGCTSVLPDKDGVRRRAPLFYRYNGRYYPSLALALAAPLLGDKGNGTLPDSEFDCRGFIRVGSLTVPSERATASAGIYWYGPYDPARPFKHYPVYQVFNSALALYNGRQPEIPVSVFKDKIVLIGPTATGIHDLHATPFSAAYPGVDLNATVISNILERHFVRPVGVAWSLLAICAMALAGALVVWRLSDWRAFIAAVALLAAGFLGLNGWLFYQWKTSLIIVAPLGALAFSFAGANLGRYVTEGREKRRYRSTLMKYVSPSLVDAMMRDRRLADLHNEKRTMSVLFSDIRGFTSISEKIPVDQLVATLNEFLNEMVGVIFAHHGTLDKFVGDCVMAFWGAPMRQDNHAELAARAALRMQAELTTLNARWVTQGRPELKIGVGINTGEMIFGNIGSERRMDFTVIGDNVNLASRLESSTKELKAAIVISDATYQQIRDLAEVRDLGTIHVKGKEVPIRVYELLAMKGEQTKYAQAKG